MADLAMLVSEARNSLRRALDAVNAQEAVDSDYVEPLLEANEQLWMAERALARVRGSMASPGGGTRGA